MLPLVHIGPSRLSSQAYEQSPIRWFLLVNKLPQLYVDYFFFFLGNVDHLFDTQ